MVGIKKNYQLTTESPNHMWTVGLFYWWFGRVKTSKNLLSLPTNGQMSLNTVCGEEGVCQALSVLYSLLQ